MGEFSLSHMLILALILLIFFGPSRLPALGQSLGKAIRGFKQGLNEIDAEAKEVNPQQQNYNNQQLNPNYPQNTQSFNQFNNGQVQPQHAQQNQTGPQSNSQRTHNDQNI